MANIFDVPTAWRDQLMPASFNDARFHCEVNSRESGRRIVEHEFPKKELPYAEDMGRSAREFTVRLLQRLSLRQRDRAVPARLPAGAYVVNNIAENLKGQQLSSGSNR